MSFSSLLPPPKTSRIASDGNVSGNAVTDTRLSVDALVQADQPSTKEPILNDIVAPTVSFQDFVPLRQRNFDMQVPLPTQKQIDETFRRTKAVFDKIIQGQLQPPGTGFKNMAQANNTSYDVEVKGGSHGTRRTFHVVERARDPLQPNTIKTRKVVAPPDSDTLATPLFHKTDMPGGSTDSTITKEEREKWKIPSAVSSWKNPNGYTVSLDKRLAMDARYDKKHMGAHEVSNGFAALSEALSRADRNAREELRLRALAKKQLLDEEAREKEEKLRLLAQKAREERQRQNERYRPSSKFVMNENIDRAMVYREKRRQEKRQELERDIRRSKMSTAERLKQLAHEQGRDVSEKVITGASKVLEAGEVHYDARLFTKGAKQTSRRSEEQVYDRPFLQEASIDTIYKTSFNRLQEMDDMNSNKSGGAQLDDPTNIREARPVRFSEAERGQDREK